MSKGNSGFDSQPVLSVCRQVVNIFAPPEAVWYNVGRTGEWPSGKAAAFGAVNRRFESFLPSLSIGYLELRSACRWGERRFEMVVFCALLLAVISRPA
jgi:hypothetical protein